MRTMEAYVSKMEKQHIHWAAKFDELVAKTEAAGAEAKIDLQKGIADLKVKQVLAQSKLDDLKVAGSENWETIKAGVENAWNELDAAFKKLTN